MELVGPAHGTNQTNVVVLSIFGNGELGRDGVDGVCSKTLAKKSSMLSLSRYSVRLITVAAGLMSWIMASITSTLRLPMVL